MSDRYAVIGHPVAHSRSPAIHEAFAAATGQSLQYERLLAPLDGFVETVSAFAAAGGRGANVTVPFKEAAAAWATTLTPRAQSAGAVNTLIRQADGWLGDNTDGVGLCRDLVDNAGWSLVGQRVLLLGAGGAARGVMAPLFEAGIQSLTLANRTLSRAQQLVDQAGFHALTAVDLAALRAPCDTPFDLIINATSASLQGDVPLLHPTVWHAQTGLYDMMYGHRTAFLDWGAAQGIAHRRDGLGMLVEQAAESFWCWRGVRPDTKPVLAQLRASLSSS